MTAAVDPSVGDSHPVRKEWLKEWLSATVCRGRLVAWLWIAVALAVLLGVATYELPRFVQPEVKEVVRD